MDPDSLDRWIRIGRDGLIVATATFMLVYETVFAASPNAEIIAAGLALLGLPPFLRLDLRTRSEKDENGNKDDR